jgi:hypothetical protein
MGLFCEDLPILAVENLAATVEELKRRCWRSEGYRFTEPGGNPLGMIQNDQPDVIEKAFANKENRNAGLLWTIVFF